MKNGFIENLSELYTELSNLTKTNMDISCCENKRILIYFHKNFVMDITFNDKLGLFSIYINSIFLSVVETQDITEYLFEIIKDSIIIQNKKITFTKKPFKIIPKESFILRNWNNKRNIKVFTSKTTLLDNF